LGGIPRPGAVLLAGWILAALSGCGFADLRTVGFTTVPSRPGETLKESYSPVVLKFDTPVDKTSAENVFQVMGMEGSIGGDRRWEGNSVLFMPAEPWRPSLRYVLRLSGTVDALDGRQLNLFESIPFYALGPGTRPLVESVSPAPGAQVIPAAVGEKILELEFSRPMDAQSVEAAFSLNCPGEKRLEWTHEGRVLQVYSNKALEPWTSYRWSLSMKALGADGSPLGKAEEGTFVTGQDREIPHVEKVLPLLPGDASLIPTWGTWKPLRESLSGGIRGGEAIGVKFSKPMNPEDLSRCFTLEPSLSGKIQMLSSQSLVFIPEKTPEPEAIYRIRITGETRDKRGLKMGSDHVEWVYSEVPYLELVSLKPGPSVPSVEAGFLQNPLSVPVYEPGIHTVKLVLTFSEPFTAEARQEAAFNIDLSAFFPDTLSRAKLRWTWFSSDKTLNMEWEGVLPAQEEGMHHYYRLLLPGGKNGLHNGSGSWMKEDRVIYLEAVKG
jgi:hypothetical protein